MFLIGFILSATSLYFFFDSVRVVSGFGVFTGFFHQHGGFSSIGVVFVPFLLGIISLFYDSSKKWAWWLLYSGIGVIVIEMLSRVRFAMNMKSSHLLILITLFGAGVGIMLKAYHEKKTDKPNE